MEHVLIWPAQYPLLLRGLAEQNGAFILDALESWPVCGTSTDEQGVESTILPPAFYLLWLKPLEPFESCYFQHIDEYDEQQQIYTQQLFEHLDSTDMTRQSLTITLLERLKGYSDLQLQIDSVSAPSFYELLTHRRYFQTMTWALTQGVKLTAVDLCDAWNNEDLRSGIIDVLPSCAANTSETIQLATEHLLKGEEYYSLLRELCDESELSSLLEQALLAHVVDPQAKQSTLIAFISQGAKGYAKDDVGRSAFMWAIEKGFVNVVEQLLPYQDITCIDDMGETCLHYAVKSNLPSMVKVILNAGCDPHQRDVHDQTAYRLTMQNGALAARKVLEEHGIIELSEDAQYNKIRQVHGLYALVTLLLPLQLFFFFHDSLNAKQEFVWGAALLGVSIFAIARGVRRGPLYPSKPHPWSLKGLSALSWLSISLQSMFSLLVLITLLGV
ncbi:ankyrin repeat domain-containing protein [Pseudoalteromonas citrea]|uniref:Ankyrin repeat domain-containing protein n=1 Tax=Pseudoalteromonas citrea TaxID=43655 RepID=A0A5S3XU78_9GAMM|nr:ankyrin repeat domain-containing protein [Pseudoalteromonas citrea]TMP43363.1 ankyrin repeat domain-containing protein [Pseudoalteromonas citrea]TMP62238.1 ankyrin repeat domain-containing protein [Pseudoalteromonas citrea]